MTHLTDLQPAPLWRHFHALTQTPRPSKKEGRVLEYLKQVSARLGHAHEQDEVGNLVIRKPATPGYEQAPVVCLQSHVDMVCERNKGTPFDFEIDPIQAYVDGDWVTAQGTTLGADNGIGVAASLAVLESRDLVHGSLECLFTVDEETGLTGAKNLRPGFLGARILLNLDSEEDGALYVGCAGGMDTAGEMRLVTGPAPAGYRALEIQVGGLKGGHSGLDIHRGRGNAIKILARLLAELAQDGAKLSSLAGGSKRNAIPREAECILYLPARAMDAALAQLADLTALLRQEMGDREPLLAIGARPVDGNGRVIDDAQFATLVDTLSVLPHGMLKMSPDIPGLVQTSTNLATLDITDGVLSIGTSQRSAVASEKDAAVAMVGALFRRAGLRLVHGDGYPGWQPNMDSFVLKKTRETFRQLFNQEPEIKAIHAGLECGLIGEVYGGMDMISFGPTIEGAHSPDERLNIPATARFWALLTALLNHIARG